MARMLRLVCVLSLFALGSALSADASLQEKPVAKVINLLKEMKDTLETEAKGDQKVYDTMACWCETNEQAKTKAVADGIHLDKKLTALIPELAAKQATLQIETEQLQKESKENEEALSEATEMRAKELTQFREEETTAVQSITGLKNAVLAIGKNHALTQEAMLQVKQMIENHSKSSPEQFSALRGGRVVASLLQLNSGSSQPQSGEIFGILKGMKESFEANLDNSRKEEKANVQAYKELKSAKEQELAASTKQIENKVKENADTGEKLENSKENLVDTRAQVKADQNFLLDLQQRCGSMDKQFADRTKVRNDETNAVNEALKILTDDDATDLFNKANFLQLKSKTSAMSKKEQALRVLRKSGNSELELLAFTMKDDVFAKIKEQIDDLIANLKNGQADEVAQRDDCIDDLNTNEKETYGKNSEKKDKETELEELNLTIEKLGDEIANAKAEIADTKKEMLKASENRELENKDFQTTVTEQRATQQILQKALKKLQAFYDAKAALLEVHATTHRRSGQAPPAGFAPMKKSEGSGGVMGMMEHIIEESAQAEAEATAGEKEAQAAYETFVKDSKEAIAKLEKSITDKTMAMEKADADRIQGDRDLKSIKGDISGLEAFATQLHANCDFLLKNFEVRQSARTGEMEALTQAKALMSGADA